MTERFCIFSVVILRVSCLHGMLPRYYALIRLSQASYHWFNVCSSRVQTAASLCKRAIDCFSRLRQQPTRALAYQNAASHLHQSGRMSGQMRILITHRRVTLKHACLTQHYAQGCPSSNIRFSVPLICFWPAYLSKVIHNTFSSVQFKWCVKREKR